MDGARKFIAKAKMLQREGNAASRLRNQEPGAALVVGEKFSVVSLKFAEVQPQILRLTTPKLKNVWGPVRSG
jgi:hypothetical protein